MKKEDVSGIVVYLLILAIAVVFGLTILREYSSQWDSVFIYILFIFGAILTGVIFNAVMFELAHIAGAKAGRYQILSVDILGLLWYKDGEKSKFKFSGYDGLTGETRILPKKDVKKEPNPTPYLMFGTLFYVIEIIVAVVLFTVQKELKNEIFTRISYFILVIAVIGGMILIYNILPFKLDATTDGYRMRMTSNKANKIAFNELLRVEEAVRQGETDVEVATFSEITNFTADLNLNKVYMLLDKGEFQEAEKLLDIIISGKETISEKVYIRARAQKIYINIFTKPLEEAKEYYDREVPMVERRQLSNDLSMVSVRTYLLMSGLLDNSKSECIIAINNVRRCFNSTPKQRRKTEANLFNEALKKVDEAHPNWKLGEYSIVYEEKPEKKKGEKKGDK